MKKLLILFLLSISTVTVIAQNESPKSEQSEDSGDKKKKKDIYKELLKDSEYSEGLFNVINKKSKLYFELDEDIFNRELLIVSRIKGHVKGLNFGGAGMRSRPQQIIRWQKLNDQIVLRSVSYDAIADPELPVYQSVVQNNFEPIIMSFKIHSMNSDSTAYVIDVTNLFTTDVAMIGAVSSREVKKFGLKGVDKNRSMVTSYKTFPQNVEIRHILTYKGSSKIPDNRVTSTLSVEMNQSFIELPEEPMQPRYYDPRVGYFSISRTNYGLDAQRAQKERLITRWRLEPVDMEAWQKGELVEVKKPIVYYIDPSTPEEWREPIKQGVNDWQKAFESIGFKNAIMAKDPPSKEEDPDWSPEDVRYSVIRYVTTDIQNAMGPHVHDPRTGEILESDIIWYHNIMRLLRNWYFIQTSVVNPDAQKLKFDSEVMGELIRFVSAHEVGHTLGLPHNMGASAAYPVDSLRSPGFVQRMGTAPSIMDYARFNYVAQPEDKGAGFHPKIGIYDNWAIKFGYIPIPQASSPEEERPYLNAMIKEKAGNKLYRYGQQRFRGHDPSAQTEDLGDDPIYASELGIKNLKRMMPNLVELSKEETKFFEELDELYSKLIDQLRLYSGHVSSNIAGVYEHQRSSDENEIVYEVVPSSRQQDALNFMKEQIFKTPEWLIEPTILELISPTGVSKRIENLQVNALNNLLYTSRLNRLVEQREIYGSHQFGIDNLLNDLSEFIFRDAGAQDSYGRTLQRNYIIQLGKILSDKNASADVKAAVRIVFHSLSHYKKYQKSKNLTLVEAHKLEILRLISEQVNGIDAIKNISKKAMNVDQVDRCCYFHTFE